MSNFMTHNLSRLASFRGRETRAQFWPYAGVVFAVVMTVLAVSMMARMGPFMMDMQAYAVAHPDQATISSGPGHYSVSIHGDDPEITTAFADMSSTILITSGGALLLMVAFYAAAVVRRLHDRGKSGLWGLMPLPFAAFSLTAMPRLFASFDAPTGPTGPTLGLFFLIFISNAAYNVVLVILIVMLAKRSDPGINRYGPPPAQA